MLLLDVSSLPLGSADNLMFNLTLSRKALLVLVAVPLAFELTFLGSIAAVLEQAESARVREGQARDVSTHANALLRLLLELATTSVVYYLSNSGGFESRYQSLVNQMLAECEPIKVLVKGDAQGQRCYDEMLKLGAPCVTGFKTAHDAVKKGDRAGGLKAFIATQDQMSRFFEATDQLLEEQSLIQQSGTQLEQSYREQLTVLLCTGVIFNVALVWFVASLFNRSTLGRLEVVLNNSMRLALRQPLMPPVGGTDEIAHLDQFFRTMASSLAEATRKERGAVENAVDVICSIDGDGKITAVNPASFRVWGYAPADLLGTRLSQIVHSEDINQTLESIRQTMDKKSVETFENRIKRKDGSLVDTLWSANWSQDERSIFCVANDITERKELDRLKREFIGLVRNDLKVPLTAIHEYLSRLDQRVQLSQAGHTSVQMAEDNVKRLIGLVNDLLDIERMESGKLELHLSPASLSIVVERSVQSVLGYAQQRKVQIETQCLDDMIVQADEDRLVQVVVNFLSNAIKFSPKDSLIVVSVEQDAESVRVSVRDRGRGVPKELREAIFERFKQVDACDETVKGGSGLGLAICKVIVEKHGGSIGVESNIANEQEQGSDFWFCLPKTPVTQRRDGTN